MKTSTQMLIVLITLAIVILCTFYFLLKLDNSRRSEREVAVTLPEPKLDTIIIIIPKDTIPQYYFIYDYE